MPDDLTNGEIRRWLERLDKRQSENAREMISTTQHEIAHKALTERVAEVEKDQAAGFARLDADMKAGFDRAERSSLERKGALERKDTELAKEIADVRKDLADDRSARERARPGTLTNWLTGIGVAVALIALVVTIVATSHGGH